jgi:DNA-binding transcriptional LysR family regulator
MELRHLRYFVAVAEELHFRRAAERLHISQPPLSEQISQLEDELGARLLERNRGREVRLTVAGAAFLEESRKILLHVAEAAEIVHRASRGEIGTLRVSLAPAMAYGVVPMILRQLRTELPTISLQLLELITPLQEKALLDRRLDVGFCYGRLQSDNLVTECIHRERLILAVPDHHPLASQTQVGLSQLKGEQFITIPRATSPGLYDSIFQTCHKAGLSPKVAQETNQFQTAVGLVCMGMGVTLVPESMVALKRKGVHYLRTEEDTPVIETLMVQLQNDPYPAMTHLMALARGYTHTSGFTTDPDI